MAGSMNEGLWRYGGMYGAAWRDQTLLAEVVEVTGAVEIGRIEVPLAGQTRQGYKPGREAREGSLRIHKIDTRWELEIHEFLSQNLTDRRANRGQTPLRPFSLTIEVDDPDALEKEAWRLDGCVIWRLPLGFSITDDILDREFPLTWEEETPVNAFSRYAEDGKLLGTDESTGLPKTRIVFPATP